MDKPTDAPEEARDYLGEAQGHIEDMMWCLRQTNRVTAEDRDDQLLLAKKILRALRDVETKPPQEDL